MAPLAWPPPTAERRSEAPLARAWRNFTESKLPLSIFRHLSKGGEVLGSTKKSGVLNLYRVARHRSRGDCPSLATAAAVRKQSLDNWYVSNLWFSGT